MDASALWAAGIGAASALAGSWLTQRWRRKDDRIRWERERQARAEQWEREDASRWLVERRQMYADFHASIDAWNGALFRVMWHLPVRDLHATSPNPRLDQTVQGRTEIRGAIEDCIGRVDEHLQLLSLMAPDNIFHLSRRSKDEHLKLTDLILASLPMGADSLNKFERRFSKLNDLNAELRRAMRKDLSVEVRDAVPIQQANGPQLPAQRS